jgi:hypothetical protein
MAKKRRTKRRSTRPLSELSRRSSLPKRRRRRAKGRGMLSEIMNPQTATESAKSVLSGTIGGFAAGMLDEPTSQMQPFARGGIFLGASFLVASVLKMPNVASGIAGAYGLMLQKKTMGLSEDEDMFNRFDYVDNLEEEAEYLDESGNPMYLAEDGQFYYLEEEEDDTLSANYLADRGYMPHYAPQEY